MFEFVIVWMTYDYTIDEKKFKLFPSTLKDVALCWFMSLKGDNITSWEQMKQYFNNKYLDYYRARDTRDDIFRIIQRVDESLEDFEEILHFSYRRAHNITLDIDFLKLVLL